jgi:hypothetical protein
LKTGEEFSLKPGYPMDVPDHAAAQLLKKVPDKVRPVHSKIIMEPATKTDGGLLSPIYWETTDGNILGPAVPEFLARDGNTFWISTTFEGRIWWINADRLRSKKAFETQRPVREIEPIRF